MIYLEFSCLESPHFLATNQSKGFSHPCHVSYDFKCQLRDDDKDVVCFALASNTLDLKVSDEVLIICIDRATEANTDILVIRSKQIIEASRKYLLSTKAIRI